MLSLTALALLAGIFSGCAALTNPVANGVPVNLVPPELLGGPSRDAMQSVPLTALRQKPPAVYRLATDDVLGVYIEGILPAMGGPNQPISNPPVYYPSQIDPLSRGLPASLGFPIPVRENGTLSLPLIDPVLVQGKSVAEAEAAIRDAYVRKGILQAGRERIIVSLMQPRITRVTVVRQEVGGFTSGVGGIVATTTKFGSGHVANLRAYENDVLTALTETGGLPGLDAYTDIWVFKHTQDANAIIQSLLALPPGHAPPQFGDLCPRVVRIPTRVLPCQPLPFRPEDIILENGDVVFVEERPQDLFYTGGLLPPGEHILPRDYDLDVVAAVAKVQGTLLNGAFNTSNLSGLLIQPGIGNPSPSLLTVIRRTANGGQVNIRVDLNRALRDRRERINVQAGDMLILQETPGEAIARYFTQTFSFSIVSEVVKTSRTTATTAATVP